jgi:type III secretory pathway lipoprotein EscJ
MSGMVQIALAEDATEAEEIQALLEDAGIESEVQSDDDSDSLKVFVAEGAVEAAQDVIESPTDPDEPSLEP